MRWNR